VDTARYRFEDVGDFWLSVNRLSHEKRIDLQVEAFRRLPRERLVIVGGPQMGVDAKKLLRSLRPPENVEVLGEVDERRLLDLYAKCRGLLATSRDEDFGLAPVEAMAAGKAVVAVDEGGYRETVVPDRTGWLVSADPESLARAIGSAAPAQLETMRSACEAQARRFDTRTFLDAMRFHVRRAAEGK
jgi:glycosyltransferase involved in cell wall biosynthesis